MAATKNQKAKKRRPKGTGTIYPSKKRKCNIDEINVNIGNGNKKKVTVSGRTKTEVADQLRDIQFKLFNGEYIEKDSTILYNYIEDQLIDKFELNEFSEPTYDKHCDTLKMLSEISDMQIQDITESTIKEFFKKKLYYSQSSINKMYELLNSAFKQAVKDKLISQNPMSNFKRPKSDQKKNKTRSLTIEEQAKLVAILKKCNILYSEIMMISMFTGMRCGEVNALNVEDINFAKKLLTL